jgi:biotin--protein ligase
MFRKHRVQSIRAEEIVDGVWLADTNVLCVPGGASIPYAKKLNGKGNENIRAFVENGGAYFGICAGAYYGADRIEFDKGGPLEVICENELQFFKVAAIGPAFGKFDYSTYRHVAASSNIINFSSGPRQANLMFYGGPYFPNADTHADISVLARYAENGQPSIIYGKCGRGVVVLCGVHLSIDVTLFDATTSGYLRRIREPLLATADVRQALIDEVFTILRL